MISSLPSALAIHTSSPNLGLCLHHPNDGITSQTWDLGRAMSTQLHHRLLEFLPFSSWSQLGLIAVATGPGGFTSTRLGVVLARTLAQQLDIPLFGISSLAAFAWHHAIAPLIPQSHYKLPAAPISCEVPAIAVQMPTRRNQLFGAIYQVRQFDPSFNPRNINLSWPSHQKTGDSVDKIKRKNQEIKCDRPTLLKWNRICLVPQQPDHVTDENEWQQQLAQLPSASHFLSIEGSIGDTVESLLDLAYINYFLEAPSNWHTVYPFYGQSPV